MFASAILRNSASAAAVKQAGKKDPELYVLAAVMSGIFGVAGFYFGRTPTSATSENKDVKVNTMAWQGSGDADSKYSYLDKDGAKDAPSALHSVVVPNVNLPKELHERFNKWGKEGY
ncbi:hypothetical protein BZA77DRAFT_329319 [Pyronema omphalodes]|nr:hypothetical protein BZA77DRAFT_329319 [Pyronema omphalodes]